MSKITLSEAVEIIPVSESTLRRHMRAGKVSSEKDRNGHNLFDTAELATRLQKQNELLMLPPPQPKRRFLTFLRRK